jgi:hypothetical protein
MRMPRAGERYTAAVEHPREVTLDQAAQLERDRATVGRKPPGVGAHLAGRLRVG